MNAIKKGKRYFNRDFIRLKMDRHRIGKMLRDYLAKERAVPPFPIPRKVIDKEAFISQESVVWLGHSTILARIDGINLIVDPMLSTRASPLSCAGPKRFEGSLTPLHELPAIDLILITHNHYDHLDQKSIMALHEQVKAIYVPLDNAKILTKWGVDAGKIREFDWFEDQIFEGVQCTFAPTQHFSGRGLRDRDRYLWGSWVVKGAQRALYVSGDSGYNSHFKMIGQKYGPFDLACIECGAYNVSWREVHMMPEESVQAAKDLDAGVMLPMHWAGFDLSTHAWDDPVNRAIARANEFDVVITTPMIGQVLSFSDSVVSERWWKR